MSTNTKTLLTVKTDKKLKRAAQETAAEIGIPLGTLVNAYLRKLARERRVEFEAPILKPNIGHSLLKASDDYRKGKNVSPKFSSADDAIKWLHRRR